MAKLTLHVDERLIEAAKKEASERGTSVSKLVSNYFRALAAEPKAGGEKPLPPITSSLVGCAKGARADEQAYYDHLERKHSKHLVDRSEAR